MKCSQKRALLDMSRINSDEFKVFCRSGNDNYFIRNRKMPLNDPLLTMINRKGLTLTLELRNYMKTTHPGISISKPGYLKQRMKLNPDAFLELYKYHNRNFYSEPGFLTYNGHLILAANGSGINIPTTDGTLNLYGTASRKNTKPQAQLGLGCIYDVMNRMILESDCNKVKFDEMHLTEKQMERLPETIRQQPYVIIMDRGIKFIVRLKSSDYKKEQLVLCEDDSIVEIKLDKTRIKHYEGTPDGERMKELRMIKVHLENGSTEILATNLMPTEFTAFEIGELYHIRWGIEIAYETLKSRLQLENFTGTKPVLLLQDIYSTIYVSNLAEDIILDAERGMDEREKTENIKWQLTKRSA